MKKLGEYMLFFGVGSIILNFFNMQFILLSWIDTWGTSVGWAIRIGLVIVGGAIWFLERKKQTAPA